MRAQACINAVLQALHVHCGHTQLPRTAVYLSVLSRRMRDCCAGQKPVLKSKQGAFQIVNSVEMFKPLSKFTKQARRARLCCMPRLLLVCVQLQAFHDLPGFAAMPGEPASVSRQQSHVALTTKVCCSWWMACWCHVFNPVPAYLVLDRKGTPLSVQLVNGQPHAIPETLYERF